MRGLFRASFRAGFLFHLLLRFSSQLRNQVLIEFAQVLLVLDSVDGVDSFEVEFLARPCQGAWVQLLESIHFSLKFSSSGFGG